MGFMMFLLMLHNHNNFFLFVFTSLHTVFSSIQDKNLFIKRNDANCVFVAPEKKEQEKPAAAQHQLMHFYCVLPDVFLWLVSGWAFYVSKTYLLCPISFFEMKRKRVKQQTAIGEWNLRFWHSNIRWQNRSSLPEEWQWTQSSPKSNAIFRFLAGLQIEGTTQESHEKMQSI